MRTAYLTGGWTVRTFAPGSASGLFDHPNAIAVLLAGGSLSVLLGLLVFVLITGRARAFRLVREQTVELRGQSVKLLDTIDELKAAQSIKDEFIGLVSHELRTPLTSIYGYTELMQDEDLPENQRAFLKVIASKSERLLRLVDDLLVMAQIQSGGLPLQFDEVMLNELVASSGEAAKPFAASKQIEVDIGASAGIAALGDQARLGQVFDNLVSNAIKYTPKGGHVSVRVTRKGETATIAVTDSGIGIPKNEQSQMFDRFFRTASARASGVPGTGLGLAITRGIVEAHGGTIGFDSIEGCGTTFRVTLPHAHDAILAPV
ncbi:MAG: sensor histidine kinase, partial [Solirubrobacteraceae bacterium]